MYGVTSSLGILFAENIVAQVAAGSMPSDSRLPEMHWRLRVSSLAPIMRRYADGSTKKAMTPPLL
jgi:hypothetical protein